MSSQGRIALAVLGVVAVLAVCWMALVAPKRAETREVDAKIAQAQKREADAAAQVARARSARSTRARDAATAARLAKAVPDDDDVGALVRQLDALAEANGIDFRAVKLVGTAAPPAAAAPAQADEAAGEEGAAADDEKKAEGEETAGAKAPVAASVAQPPPGATVGPAGLLTVPFSFTFDGGYKAMQRFLAAVDGLAKINKGRISVRGRLVTVDGFSLSAGRKGFPKVKALVSATAYLAPDPAAKPAATAGAPAGDPMTAAPGTNGAGG